MEPTCRPSVDSCELVLYDKVKNFASMITPGVQLEAEVSGVGLNKEISFVGPRRPTSEGPCRQNFAGGAWPNPVVKDNIQMILPSTVKVIQSVFILVPSKLKQRRGFSFTQSKELNSYVTQLVNILIFATLVLDF